MNMMLLADILLRLTHLLGQSMPLCPLQQHGGRQLANAQNWSLSFSRTGCLKRFLDLSPATKGKGSLIESSIDAGEQQ